VITELRHPFNNPFGSSAFHKPATNSSRKALPPQINKLKVQLKADERPRAH